MTTTRTVLLLVLAAICCTGCASWNRIEATYSRSTTLGRELIDLSEARKQGAISDGEYTTLRAQLMAQDRAFAQCSSSAAAVREAVPAH
jgi:hypothetical protein